MDADKWPDKVPKSASEAQHFLGLIQMIVRMLQIWANSQCRLEVLDQLGQLERPGAGVRSSARQLERVGGGSSSARQLERVGGASSSTRRARTASPARPASPDPVLSDHECEYEPPSHVNGKGGKGGKGTGGTDADTSGKKRKRTPKDDDDIGTDDLTSGKKKKSPPNDDDGMGSDSDERGAPRGSDSDERAATATATATKGSDSD